MRTFFLLFFGLLLSRDGKAGVEQLPLEEFRALVLAVAPKVNLFHEIWRQNPEAEIYGGTTRDYLFWLKSQFREARTPADAQKMANKLRQRAVISVSEFMVPESDVDIFSGRSIGIEVKDFGVRKVDTHSPDSLKPGSPELANELDQGFIPAEKIRLRKDRVVLTPGLGDGFQEIYDGRLRVHFASPEKFWRTTYAKQKLNHPILLALRYARLQAANYFSQHGRMAPNEKLLLAAMDEDSARSVAAVVRKCLDGKELTEFLAQPRFQSWLNTTIEKSFHAHTSPDAAYSLMKFFGVDRLQTTYAGKIHPFNSFLFAKERNPARVNKFLRTEGVDPAQLYQRVEHYFPNGSLYHGVKTDEAFRAILFQGFLGSEHGAAGSGLYAVSEKNIAFAEGWAESKDRLVRTPIKPDAKIVDVTFGEGKKLWDKFRKDGLGDYDAFAELLDADVVRYSYDRTHEAFVVKNSAVLGKPEGVHRKLLSFPDILAQLEAKGSFAEKLNLLVINQVSDFELENLLAGSGKFRRELTRELGRLNLERVNEMGLPKRNVIERLGKVYYPHALADPSFDRAAVMRAVDALGTYFEAGPKWREFYRALSQIPSGTGSEKTVLRYLGLVDRPTGEGSWVAYLKKISNRPRDFPASGFQYLREQMPSAITPELAERIFGKHPELVGVMFEQALPQPLPEAFRPLLAKMIEAGPELRRTLASTVFAGEGSERLGAELRRFAEVAGEGLAKTTKEGHPIAAEIQAVNALVEHAFSRPQMMQAHGDALDAIFGKPKSLHAEIIFAEKLIELPATRARPEYARWLTQMMNKLPEVKLPLVFGAAVKYLPGELSSKLLLAGLNRFEPYALPALATTFAQLDMVDHQDILQKYLDKFEVRYAGDSSYGSALQTIFRSPSAEELLPTLRQQIESAGPEKLAQLRFQIFGRANSGQPMNELFSRPEFAVYREAAGLDLASARRDFLATKLGAPTVARIGAGQCEVDFGAILEK